VSKVFADEACQPRPDQLLRAEAPRQLGCRLETLTSTARGGPSPLAFKLSTPRAQLDFKVRVREERQRRGFYFRRAPFFNAILARPRRPRDFCGKIPCRMKYLFPFECIVQFIGNANYKAKCRNLDVPVLSLIISLLNCFVASHIFAPFLRATFDTCATASLSLSLSLSLPPSLPPSLTRSLARYLY
jgi:hypothetical protein